MKYCTLVAGNGFHPAVLVGDDVLDLVIAADIVRVPGIPTTMRALLAADADGRALVAALIEQASTPATRQKFVAASALRPFADATLGPVVPDPDTVLSGSMNSHGHLKEMGDDVPEFPCAFHKVRSALNASGAPIVPPPGHGDMIDWEGELCVVVGKPCHAVSVEQAYDHIAGYTLMNDISAREYVMPFVTAVGPAPTAQAWERVILGKNFPGFAPIGPVIVTADEVPSPFTYHMTTRVDGEVMQSSTQEDIVFGPAEMIAYYSTFYRFEVGDIISMGSPPGVGLARKPQLFLKSGDTVEVHVDSIGTLTNYIA